MVSSGIELTSLQLPPCIAERIKEVIGSTQLALEELPLDDILDVAISDLSDWHLATHLCQRRAVLSLQCMADSAVSIECLPLAGGDVTLHDVAGVCDCIYGVR